MAFPHGDTTSPGDVLKLGNHRLHGLPRFFCFFSVASVSSVAKIISRYANFKKKQS